MPNRAEVTIDDAALHRATMPQLVHFLRNLTQRIGTAAQGEAPVRTGELKRSTSPDPVRITGPWSLESGVSARARHALFVHEGTRPHVIRPRRANALVFDIDGRTVFARRVRHPGTRPRPFLRRAAEEVVATDPHIDRG